MTNLMSELISKIVREQIDRNQSTILSKITSGADDAMPKEQIWAIMIANSIQISTELSAKIIIELLYQSGIVAEPDIKSLLKQLSSPQED